MEKTKNVSIDELLESGDAVEMTHNEVLDLLPPEEEPKSIMMPDDSAYQALFDRIDAENAAVHEQYTDSIMEEMLEKELEDDDSEAVADLAAGANKDDDDIYEDLNIEASYTSVDTGIDAIMDDKPMKEVGPEMEPEVKRVVKVEEPTVEPVVKKAEDTVTVTEEVVIKPVQEPVPEPRITSSPEPITSDIVDDDLDIDEDAAKAEVEKAVKADEERLQNIRKAVSATINPIKNPISLETFKINSKVKKTPSSILKKTLIKNHATWINSGTAKSIVMTEFTGPELIKINRHLMPEYGKSTALGNMLKIMYDHVQSPKASSVNEWAKTTLLTDLDDIFFTIFAATYGTSCLSYYDCPKCKHSWMAEGLTLKDYYNILNEEKFKAAVNRRLAKDEVDVIEETLVQVTDDLVFGIKPITLWNAFHELPIVETISDELELLFQIEDIYAINRETNSLEGVDFKTYPDPDKTIRAKYKYINKFVDSLSPDQIGVLGAAINEMNSNFEQLVQYKIPGTICPECGTHIDEETIVKSTEDSQNPIPMSAETLLFIRHQLGITRA